MCKELEMDTMQLIDTATVRQAVIDVWSKCDYGVKARWSEKYGRTTIQYIHKTPTYSKKDVMLEIIYTVREEVRALQHRVDTMNNDVESVISKLEGHEN